MYCAQEIGIGVCVLALLIVIFSMEVIYHDGVPGMWIPFTMLNENFSFAEVLAAAKELKRIHVNSNDNIDDSKDDDNIDNVDDLLSLLLPESSSDNEEDGSPMPTTMPTPSASSTMPTPEPASDEPASTPRPIPKQNFKATGKAAAPKFHRLRLTGIIPPKARPVISKFR